MIDGHVPYIFVSKEDPNSLDVVYEQVHWDPHFLILILWVSIVGKWVWHVASELHLAILITPGNTYFYDFAIELYLFVRKKSSSIKIKEGTPFAM